MPRKRIRYRKIAHGFPSDFPERLKRFKEDSGLSWAEIARQVGADAESVRRRKKGQVRPKAEHLAALLVLGDSFGLGHLFRDCGRGTETKKGRHIPRFQHKEAPGHCGGPLFSPRSPGVADRRALRNGRDFTVIEV